MRLVPRQRPAIERFVEKVEKHDDDCPCCQGCWLWIAGKTRDGYGAFGPGVPIRGSILAHRWSFAHFVSEIPDGANILHRCDTPACVRPDHLYIGDQAQNVADAIERGRWGHQGPFHKLSPELHQEIVRLYSAGDVSQTELARRFGVTQTTISHIVVRATGRRLSSRESGQRRATLAHHGR